MGDDSSEEDKPAEDDTIADGEWWWEEDEMVDADEDEDDEEDEVLFITSDIDQIFGFVEVVVVGVVDEEAAGDVRLGLTAEGGVDLLASPPEAQEDVGLLTPDL